MIRDAQAFWQLTFTPLQNCQNRFQYYGLCVQYTNWKFRGWKNWADIGRVLQKSCSQKIRSIHRKTPVLELLYHRELYYWLSMDELWVIYYIYILYVDIIDSGLVLLLSFKISILLMKLWFWSIELYNSKVHIAENIYPLVTSLLLQKFKRKLKVH